MQRNQLRLQQQAAAAGGMPGYPGQPMYYPQPGFPGQPGGGMMQRPRYAPAGMMPQGMGGMPYGQTPQQFPGGMMPPQGYRPPRPRGAPNAGGMPGGVRPGMVNGGPRPGQPMPGQMAPRGAVPPPGARPGRPQASPNGQPALTAAALANAGPEEQKQMLGEAIYPKIAASHSELAGKLTGMILELPVSELLHLLEDTEALDAKVAEALDVLREFERNDAQAALQKNESDDRNTKCIFRCLSRELVKYMCNIPSANKHAAARAASRLGEETIMEECARSPTFATQARIAIGLEEEDCLGACSDSMSSWKRAESNRNKELAAKVVSSMDELFSTSSQEQQEDLAIRRPSLTPATPSRSSSALSYHRNMCVPTSPTTKSQASSHYSLGNEEDELEDLLCPRTIQYFSAPNSWQRTWGGQRPATPQTNTSFGRRASENDASQVSFSDRIADLKSNQRVQFHQEGLVGSESKPFERSQSSSNLLSSRLIGGRKMGERRLNMSCDRSAAPSPVGSNYSSYLFEENTNRMAKSANT
ncbi:hypothetical protein IEQ34_025991 [Dendrobium chrysotoxum]|uniref:PABC domain-containing protein n=1 Tax=Dendrobium chrysotoxum TaxID=161865 RepID=A0AAV7FN13_DENCH|nr:hypothetical protein IEQ34_025991 [Dendrobium chrysotoxum]